jgi:hypothetical protein
MECVAALFVWFACLLPGPAQAQTMIDIPLTETGVPAHLRTIRVHEGDELVLRWTSETEADLHLHGCRVTAHVRPGEAAEMRLLAAISGRFAVEAHSPTGERRPIYLEAHPQ